MIDINFITLGRDAKDIAGQKFGRLTALGPVGKTKHRRVIWLCQCECGKQLAVVYPSLARGLTQSCGCLRKEIAADKATKHGLAFHPFYSVWAGIINRCENPDFLRHETWGGRGIRICDEWRHDFPAFLSHISGLAHYAEQGYSIDRIDNSKGYFPGNIRFATPVEQGQNTRRNHLLTYNNKTQCIAAWAKELGIHRSIIHNRLRGGWSVERALSQPVKTTSRRKHE